MSDETTPQETRNEKGSSFTAIRFVKLAVLGVICWLVIRAFFIQGMYIPSDSMRGTLNPGDVIYVNKLAYGPRIPITPLCIPFTNKFLDWVQLPYWRIPGYSEVAINDIIVFNLPIDSALPVDCRELYIKRCVGLPGDSFAVVRGVVTVNGKAIANPLNTTLMFAVALKSEENPDSLFGKLGIGGNYSTSDRIHYTLFMTWLQADRLDSTGKAASITPSVLDVDRYDYKLFPQNTSKQYRWNCDNFGPVKIPKAGDVIAVSKENIALYKTAIVEYEGNKLENRHDSVFINGAYTTAYAFKLNYYFVMGDNRYDSNDSRFWGFVPEDHLVGRVIE